MKIKINLVFEDDKATGQAIVDGNEVADVSVIQDDDAFDLLKKMVQLMTS